MTAPVVRQAFGESAPLPPGFAAWRTAARAWLAADVPPDAARWDDGQLLLGGAHAAKAASESRQLRVPRSFLRLAESVACHRDQERWDLLYRVLWRMHQGERELLQVATDPDTHRLTTLDKAVRRAAHKMTAFVRFRRMDEGEGAVRYVAWFEPAHHVVERTAPFFARRFAAMRWSILTPERCVHWDGTRLAFADGVSRSAAPEEDALEDLWREYYANIFNPARAAPSVMRAEMPKSYWKNLPEASLIPALTREAPARVAAMLARVESPPESLPDDLRRIPSAPDEPRPDMTGAAVARPRRSGLDLPSWDRVHDPGPREARRRADALRPGSGTAIALGDVTVMPGVAGWTDPTLLAPGVFYPDDAVTPEARLRFYAERFAMVEVDSTYYSLPRREHAVAWVRRTPPGFIFNVKAHALMTGHPADVRRLPDWLRRAVPPQLRLAPRVYGSDLSDELLGEVWRRFLAAVAPLQGAGKLGAVFLQFPRWFTPSRAAARLLRSAARALGDVRGAVEFRNPAWVEPPIAERTFGFLADCGLAYTVVDAPPGTSSSMPPVVRVTRPDFAVVRLHGRRVATWEARNEFVTERYRYLYSRDQVASWAERVLEMASSMGRGMLQVAYNNNHANYATTNAAEFGEDLSERRPFDGWRPTL